MEKENIYENLAENIGLEKFKRIDRKQRKIKSIITNTFTLAICTLSITGMVFAKEISTKVYENFFGTGNGVGKAIEEGYIEEAKTESESSESIVVNEETGQVIEDFETSIKVDKFVMDDFTLSITFDVEFSDKIKEMIEPSKMGDMNFPDLVIYDENNVILYCMGGNRLTEFCKEKNIGDYDYNTIPEDMLINSGVECYIQSKNQNSVKMLYNIYTGGDVYPKSKKLYFDMNKIKISGSPETLMGEEEITLSGDWKFSVDVPEKMYNRSNIVYKQKSSTNDDFKVTAATIYDTGMDISLEFKVGPAPEAPSSPELDFYNSLPEGHELKTLDILNYYSSKLYKTPEYQEYGEKQSERWHFEKYLVNEEGEKFELTQGPRENGSGRIDNNNIYYFNGMFDLTKYDMTDVITVFVDYHGNKAEIILEKVEE